MCPIGSINDRLEPWRAAVENINKYHNLLTFIPQYTQKESGDKAIYMWYLQWLYGCFIFTPIGAHFHDFTSIPKAAMEKSNWKCLHGGGHTLHLQYLC